MGVKSTTRLTRADAEAKFVELFLAQDENLRRRQARSQAALLTDRELEDKLEEMNDARYEDGQGGFDNYLVTEHVDD